MEESELQADVRRLLNAGADKVSFNTTTILNPDILNECSETFGSQCTVLAIDAKLKSMDSWNVYTHGGRNPTDLDAVKWAVDGVKRGVGEILLTSMDCDGTKSGFDIKLTILYLMLYPFLLLHQVVQEH